MCTIQYQVHAYSFIQSRNVITRLSSIPALSQDHVIELFSQHIHIFNVRPLSQSEQEELFCDDIRRVDTCMTYYEHIEECLEVFRSLHLLPEMVFSLILPFLVNGDPPARFVPVGLKMWWRNSFFE